ncbi:hypothetical protein Godav_009760, partial [Gossypium davidsonii]|nr:hypothetical protein [Gossypium davidsonii]
AKQYAFVTNLYLLNHSRSNAAHSLSKSWVYLNTDGSVRPKDAFAVVGGHLRDRNGGWIIGFSRYLGNCIVLDFEL